MTNNNNTQQTSVTQALFVDIYNNLIAATIKKAYGLTNLSDNEAKSKSAIMRKLTKANVEKRHDILTDFITTKIITVERQLSWELDKSTIIRMFENHLIDQYRHENTKQQGFENSIIYLESEQLQPHINKWEDEMIKKIEGEEKEMQMNKRAIELAYEFNKTLDEDMSCIFTWWCTTNRDEKSLQPVISYTALSRKTIYRRLDEIKAKFFSFVANNN